MHATFTRPDRTDPPDRPHSVAVAVFNDPGDPDGWHVDVESGENTLDIPAGCGGEEVAAALASLGCRRISLWHRQTACLWIAAIAPATPTF